MAGRGLQDIPFRIPEKWDAAWYARHIREVLALADTRNALEGSGIVITGQPNEQATISTSEDLQNLLLQTFVLAEPSGFLAFERVLAGETDVIEITDGGAGGNITVGIEDHGINLGKLLELSSAGVLGNPVDAVGEVQNITPEQALAVLHYDGTGIVFDVVDHTYVSDFNEAAQDAVGGILTDSSSIDFTYNDVANTITASIIDEYVQDLVGAMLVDSSSIDFTYNDGAGTFTAATINANPTGTIGLTAVNGTAATPMRSDAAPALDQAIAPVWTGHHEFRGAARTGFGTYAGISLGQISNSQAELFFNADPGAGTADEHIFALTYSGGAIRLRTFNDAGTVSRDAWRIEQAGAAITSEQYGNSTDNPPHLFYGNIQQAQDNYELQIGAGQDLRLYHDGTNSIIRNDTGVLKILEGATEVARFDTDSTAGNTRFMVYDVDNGTLERVSVGATDSGGTGFKLLRIPN